MLQRFAAMFAGAVLAVLGATAGAQQVGSPTGPVVLTVRDQSGHVYEFDRSMLQALDWQTIRTVTSFTDGVQEFSGVPLSALVAATGVTGTVFDAVALNDYRVEVPVEHIASRHIFLALDANGTPMRVRDKGPVWIIYPADELKPANERFDQYMVWQLRELTFR